VNPKVRIAVLFVESNFHRDIYVAEITDLVRLSRSRFSDLFKSELGKPFIQYLKKARMEKARQLLETTFEPSNPSRSMLVIATPLISSATSRSHMT